TPQTFTLASLAAPAPNGPSGTIAASTGYDVPTFKWSSVAGADHYSLVVIDNTTPINVVININTNGTSFTPSTALTPGHNYTWYVGAISTNGQASTYDMNTPQNLALASLAPPTPMGPNGTIAASTGYDTPTFSWHSVAGADHYAVVALDNSANNKVAF